MHTCGIRAKEIHAHGVRNHSGPPNTPPAKWLIIHDKHELLGIPLGNIGAVISGVYAIGETFFS